MTRDTDPPAGLDSLHRLWYRANRREAWRVILEANALEANAAMWKLIDERRYPSGDWSVLPITVDANAKPTASRATA